MVIQGILSTGSAGCPVCQLNQGKACKSADSVTVIFRESFDCGLWEVLRSSQGLEMS